MKSFLATLFVLLGLAVTVNAEGKVVPYGDNPAAGHYFEIRGIKMYCEVYGTGKPLLMIHGNGGSIQSFRHNIPYFAERYQVIVADSRSQGKSTDTNSALTFEMMADDDAALLDALHIPSAYVIGWSDGGINALLLAMRHPEKVIRLASTGANLWPDAAAFSAGVWDETKKDYEKGKNKPHNTEKEKNDWKLCLLDYNEPHIALSSLHSISCPALIICGDHDMISIEHTTHIFQNIPHAALWVVPNSGHATLIEHRDEFNRLVDNFFSAASPTKK